MDYKDILEAIRKNKKRRKEGKFNSIPFALDKLNKVSFGIAQGVQYCISASSGVGKTQLAKYLFVQYPFQWVKEHPEANIKLKLFYFAHEESIIEFICSMISSRLKKLYNKNVSVKQIRSYGDSELDDETMKQIEDLSDYFQEFQSCIQIIDTLNDVHKMYQHVESYMRNNGKVYFKSLKTGEVSEEKKNGYVISHYVPDDPDLYVGVITDHVSLSTSEASTHETMSKWSDVYTKRLTKIFNCFTLDIQQQAAETEKVQYTNRGETVDEKMVPSLAGLGDNKKVGRNYQLCIGIYAPDRYGIQSYGSGSDGSRYRVAGLNDHIRFINVMKNRFGPSNGKFGVYFNGETNEFIQLPDPAELTQKDYANIALGTYQRVDSE